MQTIARAHRVFPGKHSGTVVDYANVFASLEKALAIYGKGKGGANPIQDKAGLVEALREAIQTVTAYCTGQGLSLPGMEALPAGGLERLEALENAVEALIGPDEVRIGFLAQERLIATLHGAVKPNPAALEFPQRVLGLSALAAVIKARMNPNPPDIGAILAEIGDILDQSIAGTAIREDGPAPMDMSRIDFEALSKRLKESKRKQTDLEMLKAALRARLAGWIGVNRTRADFLEKFEALIADYNSGSRNIESLSEEDLVLLDILTRPAPDLSERERAEVKKVAKELLPRIKRLWVLNRRGKPSARSKIRIAIEDTLDSGLPRAYSPDRFGQKCSAAFEHIYEAYPEPSSPRL